MKGMTILYITISVLLIGLGLGLGLGLKKDDDKTETKTETKMKLLKDFSDEELYSHKRGQKVMTDIFREFDKICRDNDLKYWCIGGTLIGAIRHKGWIPHDGDIDVGMLESDYDKLKLIIQDKLSEDYWFVDKFTDKYWNHPYKFGKIRYLHAYYIDEAKDIHRGIQLDIFVYTPKNNILTPSMCWNDSKPYKDDIILPLQEIYFEDIKVYVPNQLEKYSKDAWGDYPPKELPVEKQYPHEGRISFTIPQWMKDKYPNLYKE